MTASDFPSVFKNLRAMLKPFEARLILTADELDDYSLSTPYSQEYRKEFFVAGVQIKKNYVSYHLMPVYIFPSLLDGISPELKKHMQGKSCFNFKKVDRALFGELSQLTKRGFKQFRREGPPTPPPGWNS
jgi:hypothetical protein